MHSYDSLLICHKDSLLAHHPGLTGTGHPSVTRFGPTGPSDRTEAEWRCIHMWTEIWLFHMRSPLVQIGLRGSSGN